MTGSVPVFAAEDLRRFTHQVFEWAGMPPDEAALMADHLVWAELRGTSWLGLRKVRQYVARMRQGGTRPVAEVVVVRDRAAFALLDARASWAQVVGVQAMRVAVRKARDAGVAAVVVRDTTSAGALGYYAALAAAEGLIGLVINNSAPLQAAPGGAARVVGNQAFAVAAPAERHEALLLDMATSSISLARIHEHQHRGESLPGGVAVAADGEPTVDPAEALAGALLPMGGHRGYGLALMWEVLTGVLAGGSRFAADVTLPDQHDRPQAVSMFLLALEPAAALAPGDFPVRVDQLIDLVHASPTVAGVERVLVPGERGHATAAARQRDGIPLPPDLVAELQDQAAQFDLQLPPPLETG